MKFLRKAASVTSLDRLHKCIRNRICIISFTEPIESQQIQWFEHIMIMEHNHLPTSYKARHRKTKKKDLLETSKIF